MLTRRLVGWMNSVVDAGYRLQVVGARVQGHDDFFQRRVAGALADAVDRDLRLPRAGVDGREGVGGGQAEVVVAVHAQDRLVDVGRVLADVAHEGGELLRDRVADRVGQVHGGRTGVDGRLEDAAQVVAVAARAVFGRELHVVREGRGVAHGVDGGPNHLVAAHLELVLQVDVGGRDEGVDARRSRRAGRPSRRGRCRGGGARQAASWPGSGRRSADGLEVASEAAGNPASITSTPSFSSCTAIRIFSPRVHAGPGALLAVSQGGVEDDQTVSSLSFSLLARCLPWSAWRSQARAG